MVTRWHIPNAVKLSDIKIEDRIKELHISSNRLADITSQLTRTEMAEGEIKAEAEKKIRMKNVSDEMTKNWSDSIQKQQAKKRAHLHDLMHKQDDINLIKYLKVKKEQEEDMKQYVDEMHQKMLVRQDFPKTLASAYLFSEVLHEREKQKDFKKLVKKHEKDDEQVEYVAMIADCESYIIEEEAKKKKRKETDLAFAEELLKQKKDIDDASKNERDMRIEEELMDQMRARQEFERINMIRNQKIAKTRSYAKEALMDFMEVQRIEREKEVEENRVTEGVTKIIQNSKDRIRTLMKMKGKEMTDARFAKGLMAFDNSKQLKREEEINLIYERGAALKEANEKARNDRRAAKQLRLRKERTDQQAQYLIDSEEGKKQHNELVKFEMMNRFKTTDEEQVKVEAIQKQKYDNRELLVHHYDKDVQLKKERLQKEEHETEEVAEQIAKYESDDKMYLEYAEDIRKQVKDNEWSTHPIDVVITNYRQKTMGEKRPKRCDHLKNKLCANKIHFNEEPGKRTHCQSTDPTKCKHRNNQLYK